MGYSYVYPPLKKPSKTPAIDHPPPPPNNLHPSVKPGSFIDFGSGSVTTSNSQFNAPPRNPSPPLSRPPPPPPSESFSRPGSGPSQDFDNFIPDFDPQEELEAFMNSIGDDFKDFNFERPERPVRNQVNKH